MSTLGPWAGMDNVANDTALAATKTQLERVVLAQDGVFTSSGEWVPRALETLVASGDAHSVWQAQDGRVFAVFNGVLSVVDSNGTVTPLSQTVLGEVSFTQLPDTILASDAAAAFYVLSDNTTQNLAPKPMPPVLGQSASGGLAAGIYTVAVSYTLKGVEGGLSRHATVPVSTNDAISVLIQGNPNADGYVLYRTGPDGDVLYRAASGALDPWGASVTLQHDMLGDVCAVDGLQALPSLRLLTLWNGRVLGAVGRRLVMSQALRYGLHSPSYDFIQAPAFITAIYPTDDGVFVATAHAIYFLAGRDPAEWVITTASTLGTAVNALDVPAELLDPEFIGGAACVGVFFTTSGHALALPGGVIRLPQAGVLNLPAYAGGQSFVLNEHIVTLVKE